MDFLQLNYRLLTDQNAERTLFVRVYKLVDEEQKSDRVLEVLNVPFFVEEDHLKNLFKCKEIQVKFVVGKASSDKLKTKSALVEFGSKKELKNELRLIKYLDGTERLFLYKTKVSECDFLSGSRVHFANCMVFSFRNRRISKRPSQRTAAKVCCPSGS